MTSIHELFFMKSVVGAKLEKLLEERNMTKSGFCREVHISRPTLDKILGGDISSITNYEKHLTKILDYLQITPDELIGNPAKCFNQCRTLIRIMHVDENKLAEEIGISTEQLKEIERGNTDTDLAILRDLAFVLQTSTSVILGKNIFDPQIATLNTFLSYFSEKENNDYYKNSGYWGHVGLNIKGSSKLLWYPITKSTREDIYQTSNNKYQVIPCMNNRLLLVNMANINRIVMVDNDIDSMETKCEGPDSAGEYPLAFYEIAENYMSDIICGEEISEKEISSKMLSCIKEMEKNGVDLNYFVDANTIGNIFYSDGTTVKDEISFYYFEDSLFLNISAIYMDREYMEDDIENCLLYHDISDVENFINLNNLAIMELPLLKTEEAIYEEMKFREEG